MVADRTQNRFIRPLALTAPLRQAAKRRMMKRNVAMQTLRPVRVHGARLGVPSTV